MPIITRRVTTPLPAQRYPQLSARCDGVRRAVIADRQGHPKERWLQCSVQCYDLLDKVSEPSTRLKLFELSLFFLGCQKVEPSFPSARNATLSSKMRVLSVVGRCSQLPAFYKFTIFGVLVLILIGK